MVYFGAAKRRGFEFGKQKQSICIAEESADLTVEPEIAIAERTCFSHWAERLSHMQAPRVEKTGSHFIWPGPDPGSYRAHSGSHSDWNQQPACGLFRLSCPRASPASAASLNVVGVSVEFHYTVAVILPAFQCSHTITSSFYIPLSSKTPLY